MRIVLKAVLLIVLGYALGTLIVFCRLRPLTVVLYGVPLGLALYALQRKIRSLRPAPPPEREWLPAREALRKGLSDHNG